MPPVRTCLCAIGVGLPITIEEEVGSANLMLESLSYHLGPSPRGHSVVLRGLFSLCP